MNEQPKAASSKRPRYGFAGMSPERQREIASNGGKAAHALGKANRWTSETARAAGRKGGQAVARDREHMASIGRKGGTAVSADREHMSTIGKLGGAAVSVDRQHMADIGTSGGGAHGKNTYHG